MPSKVLTLFLLTIAVISAGPVGAPSANEGSLAVAGETEFAEFADRVDGNPDGTAPTLDRHVASRSESAPAIDDGTDSDASQDCKFLAESSESRRIPTTFTVVNLDDDGPSSLRQAIIDANAGGDATDVIEFQDGLAGTISLASGEIAITGSLIINCPGSDAITVDAQGNSRIFNIDDSNASNLLDVEIVGLTLTGGNAAVSGGAIRSQENLTISNSAISGNSVTGSGGGIGANDGRTAVYGSIMNDNLATGSDALGGAIYGNGEITVEDSAFSSN